MRKCLNMASKMRWPLSAQIEKTHITMVQLELQNSSDVLNCSKYKSTRTSPQMGKRFGSYMQFHHMEYDLRA